MIQIRQNIFETNSSSVHSITLCTEDEFQKWKNGEIFFDRCEEKFLTPKEAEEVKKEQEKERERLIEQFGHDDYFDDEGRTLTYKQFFDWQGDDNYLDYMEKFQSHQNINGVDVVAFGYYGHD